MRKYSKTVLKWDRKIDLKLIDVRNKKRDKNRKEKKIPLIIKEKQN